MKYFYKFVSVLNRKWKTLYINHWNINEIETNFITIQSIVKSQSNSHEYPPSSHKNTSENIKQKKNSHAEKRKWFRGRLWEK